MQTFVSSTRPILEKFAHVTFCLISCLNSGPHRLEPSCGNGQSGGTFPLIYENYVICGWGEYKLKTGALRVSFLADIELPGRRAG